MYIVGINKPSGAFQFHMAESKILSDKDALFDSDEAAVESVKPKLLPGYRATVYSVEPVKSVVAGEPVVRDV